MTVPAQFAKRHGSGTACIELEGVELNADNRSPDHRAQLSAEKTTAALVALYDRPVAAWAATALWDENREAIEREMARSLHSSSDAGLRERVLSGLVSQARFFCLEVDEPKAWVARCANLESRRVALTLKK
jgi:hypothetical protein